MGASWGGIEVEMTHFGGLQLSGGLVCGFELSGGDGKEEIQDLARCMDDTEPGSHRVGGQSLVGQGGDDAERTSESCVKVLVFR